MQKPIQEYVRGLYGGYTSEATRKATQTAGGDGMDLRSIPITANPLELALRLTDTERMVPKPLSALPEYVDPIALNAIRAMLSVPLMGGGLGAEIKAPAVAQDDATAQAMPPASAIVAQMREKQIKQPEQTEQLEQAVNRAVAKQPIANIRNLWTQINALGMSIPDAKRRHAFVANEIERMKAEGEIDEKSATTLHNWNTSINAPQEEKGIDDRLLWLLMIASMFQR